MAKHHLCVRAVRGIAGRQTGGSENGPHEMLQQLLPRGCSVAGPAHSRLSVQKRAHAEEVTWHIIMCDLLLTLGECSPAGYEDTAASVTSVHCLPVLRINHYTNAVILPVFMRLPAANG